MNVIDIITLAFLAWAVYNGWSKGVIHQICTLAGIVLGIWLGVRYGAHVGALLHIGPEFAFAGGFAVVLVGVMIVVALLARLLRNIFHFAGLGTLDVLLGVLFSCIKMLLILCALFWVFDTLNGKMHLVSNDVLDGSRLYHPILGIADRVADMGNDAAGTIGKAL
ncbi:MAG: CvpA family protein [Alistipes sp.]|nr:CvpA family protein [Alistipes sp.]